MVGLDPTNEVERVSLSLLHRILSTLPPVGRIVTGHTYTLRWKTRDLDRDWDLRSIRLKNCRAVASPQLRSDLST